MSSNSDSESSQSCSEENTDKNYYEIPSNLDSEEEKEENEKDLENEHKKSLKNLSNTDPDLYDFLLKNDKSLLEFNLSDDEDNDEQDDKIHVPKDLENPSDDEDFENMEFTPINKINHKMVEKWKQNIHTDKSNNTIISMVNAFHAALNRILSEESTKSDLKIESSSVFNSVVQLCMLELQPALKKFLKIGPHTSPLKSPKWKKVRKILSIYFQDLIKLISNISSDQIILILLKHLHQMVSFLVCFKNLIPKYVKLLTNRWSSAEETVRVLAFLCLLKLCVNYNEIMPTIQKAMYLSYVRNSKFVSPNSLPEINFCRRSLTEIFSLNETIAYEHAFLYLRQLAIHLRNAITVTKMETRQAVYNWQFVNSLHFFSDLLSVNQNKSMLSSLIYPYVQIVIGTIKNATNAQYYPLRFHCCKMLINLSKNTNIFIPILPFYLSILHDFNFNKKHSKVSMKPLDITCILRLSKSQLTENGFKESIINNIYQHLLEYLTNESHRIGFPDLSITVCVQLRQFIKKCKSVNFTKKFKHLLEKIEENVQFIETQRKTASFGINSSEIEAWETKIKLNSTPLIKFYETWKKQNEKQLLKATVDEISTNETPKKLKSPTKEKKVSKRKPFELFSSDEETVDEPPVKKPKTKLKKKNVQEKKTKMSVNDISEKEDIVEDLDLSNF